MCGKIMTVLLIFVLIVLNCSMARYNGQLHCIVGVLQAQSSHLFVPPGWHGALKIRIVGILLKKLLTYFEMLFVPPAVHCV